MTTTDLECRAGHPFAGLGRGLAEGLRRIRRRRGIRRLRDLDDWILDDIGVTRAEVEHAAGLPLSRDAATELRRLSLERRRGADARPRLRARRA